MAKNIASQTLEKGLENHLNKLKSHTKQQRVNQNYPLGWFPLPGGTADPTGASDGSLYYNTSTHHIRALIFGTWTTVI